MESSSAASSNLDREKTVSAYRSAKSRLNPALTQSSMQQAYGGTQLTTQNTGRNDQSRRLSAYSPASNAGAFSPAYQLDPQNPNSHNFISQPTKISTSIPTPASASASAFASTSMSTAKPNNTNSGNSYETSKTWSTLPAAGTNFLATKTAFPPTNTTSFPNLVGGYQSNITPAARTIPLATTTTSPSMGTLASTNSVRGYQSSAAWSTPPVAQATPLATMTASTSIATPNPPDPVGGGYQSKTASSNNAAAHATQQSATNTANFQQGTYPTASPVGYSPGVQPYWDGRQWRY
ncbi:hypothetical protein N431DRAFT_140368 [Stipitochalara longipes BDJ]|nr:hypothetical protein N431DRAFT_140368 [Stipitochalara longipes BDJ]